MGVDLYPCIISRLTPPESCGHYTEINICWVHSAASNQHFCLIELSLFHIFKAQGNNNYAE